MNLFTHYKQRENHCTNILLNLCSLDGSRLLKMFAQHFLPQGGDLNFGDPRYVLFSSIEAEQKEYQYAVAIAPFPRKHSDEPANPESIPDAWVLGENVSILFEFKISGTINEAQFRAHRNKFSANCYEVEITRKEIEQFLKQVEVDSVMSFLINQYTTVIMDLESHRSLSGMPKQIVSKKKARSDEPFFIITGNARIGQYRVEVELPTCQRKELCEGLGGIQESRRWIERYIQQSSEPLIYKTKENMVIDHCINPGRTKNDWNRWFYESQNAIKS